METKIGGTRIVLLCGGRAVKIAKVRLLRFVFRMIIFPFSGKERAHFLEKYGPTFTDAVWRSIFTGVIANRNEYVYSCSHCDPRIMPTERMFFGGLIVVQPRGVPVSQEEFLREASSPFPFYEASSPQQFCRNRTGRMVLVDYGFAGTTQILRESLPLRDAA